MEFRIYECLGFPYKGRNDGKRFSLTILPSQSFFFSFETHQQRLWHCLSYSRQDNLHCAVAGFRNWLVWLCSLQNEISIAMKNNSQLQFFVLSQTHLQRLWHGLFCSKTIELHCAGSGLELSSLTLQSPERNLNNDGIKKRAPYNTFSLALCRLPAVVNLFLFFLFSLLFYFISNSTPRTRLHINRSSLIPRQPPLCCLQVYWINWFTSVFADESLKIKLTI